MCVYIEDGNEMIFIDDDGNLTDEDLEISINSPIEEEFEEESDAYEL